MSGVSVVNDEGGRRDDTKEYAEILSSFKPVRVKGNDQKNLFRIVVMILHLPNIDFAPAHEIRFKVGKVVNL